MKNKYFINFLKAFIKTQGCKLIFLILLLNSFYGGYILYNKNINMSYTSAYIHGFSWIYFLIILFSLFLCNTYMAYSQLEKNLEYRIRQKKEENFLKNCISYIRKTNALLLLLQIITFTIIFNFVNGFKNIVPIEFFLLLYYFIKIYFISFFLTEINIYAMHCSKKYIVLLLNILLYIGMSLSITCPILKINNFIIYGYIGDYLNPYLFPNILLDISSFIAFCCLFSLFTMIIIKLNDMIMKNIFYKKISQFKYILWQGLNNIIHSKKRFGYLYILLIIFSFFLVFFTSSTFGEEEVLSILGLHFYFNTDPISTVLFLLHMIFAIYLFVFLFTIDIYYNMHNIFLRMTAKEWIFHKLISSSIIYFLIKLIIYVVISLLLLLCKIPNISIFTYFLLDFIYFSCIQLFTILIYIIKKIYKIIILLIFSITIFLLNGFHIIQYMDYLFLLVIVIGIIVFFIKTVFEKSYPRIFEGGNYENRN